jgi:hypothetical protein
LLDGAVRKLDVDYRTHGMLASSEKISEVTG